MKKITFVFLLILFFRFGLYFFQIKSDSLPEGELVKITGFLSEEPQIFGNQQRLEIGNFSVLTEKYPLFHYGQKVRVTGKIKEDRFLSYPKIEPVGNQESKNFILNLAINLRIKFRNVFNHVFSKPYDGIASGIVLGDKTLIDPDFWEKLKATGTLHIMVASGSNIAMFSEGFLALLCVIFVRKLALAFLIALIWFYTLISCFQPPIVRAAIMASLVYLAQFFGRQSETKTVFWLTGGIMLLVSPLLVKDIGFQLSFSATAGLVYLQPKIARKTRSQNLSSSLSAQIATLPVLLLNFGQINLISPLINLLILWTIPFILQLGMGVGISGLVGGVSLAKVLGLVLYPLLYYLKWLIDISAKYSKFLILNF